MKPLLIAPVLAVAGLSAAAQEQQTVGVLMKGGFTVSSAIPTSAGPGLFLSKGEKLFFCIVAETDKSPDVATRYCKPVR